MLSYKEYKKLHESFFGGGSLGVSAPNNLGLVSNLGTISDEELLDEVKKRGKKKNMMIDADELSKDASADDCDTDCDDADVDVDSTGDGETVKPSSKKDLPKDLKTKMEEAFAAFDEVKKSMKKHMDTDTPCESCGEIPCSCDAAGEDTSGSDDADSDGPCADCESEPCKCKKKPATDELSEADKQWLGNVVDMFKATEPEDVKHWDGIEGIEPGSVGFAPDTRFGI